jgi:hypothetical protein
MAGLVIPAGGSASVGCWPRERSSLTLDVVAEDLAVALSSAFAQTLARVRNGLQSGWTGRTVPCHLFRVQTWYEMSLGR